MELASASGTKGTSCERSHFYDDIGRRAKPFRDVRKSAMEEGFAAGGSWRRENIPLTAHFHDVFTRDMR